MTTALVTGANRGLGLELTRQLLESGATVFAGCRQPSQAVALEQLRQEHADNLTLIALDVSSDVSVSEAFAAVSTETSELDWLINNAGINHRQTYDDFVAADMLETFDVNTVGTMRVATAFASLLERGDRPKLVNMSSQLGSLANPMEGWGHYGYNASKAAINMLTRYLALDLEGAGITVISMHPGWAKTDMGGEEAPTEVNDSVSGVLDVVNRVGLTDSGKFFAYTGDEHPW